MFVVCLFGLAFVRDKILWATLAVSGFCWTLPLRHTSAFHDYESLAYTGIPLVFFALAALYVHRRFGNRPILGMSAAALLVFMLSSFQIVPIKGEDESASSKAVLADFQAIRRITEGKSVLVLQTRQPDGSVGVKRQPAMYYLAGNTIMLDTEGYHFDSVDFVVARDRLPGPALLTPDNQQVFIYDLSGYNKQLFERTIDHELGSPTARSTFDIYLRNNTLFYVKHSCRQDDITPMFFLHVTPADPNDLPDYRRESGFDNLDFDFGANGSMADGRCLAIVHLPDYAIASIRTGQYVPDEGRIWTVDITVGES